MAMLSPISVLANMAGKQTQIRTFFDLNLRFPRRSTVSRHTEASQTLKTSSRSPNIKVLYIGRTNTSEGVSIKKTHLAVCDIHTAQQCRQTPLNPPSEVIEETRHKVAQMANGGVQAPLSDKSKKKRKIDKRTTPSI